MPFELLNMPPPPAITDSFKPFALTSPKGGPANINSRSPVKRQQAPAAATKPLCIVPETLHGTAQAKVPTAGVIANSPCTALGTMHGTAQAKAHTAAAAVNSTIAGRVGSTGDATGSKATGNDSYSTGRQSKGSPTGQKRQRVGSSAGKEALRKSSPAGSMAAYHNSSIGRQTQHAGTSASKEGSPYGMSPDPEGIAPDHKGSPAGKIANHGSMKSKGASIGGPAENGGRSSRPGRKLEIKYVTDKQLASRSSPKLGSKDSLKAKHCSISSSPGRQGSKGGQGAKHDTGHSPTGKPGLETSPKGSLVGISPTGQAASHSLPLGKPEPITIPAFPHRPLGSLEGSLKGNTIAHPIGKARSGSQSPVHKRHCSRWD